MDLFMIVPIVGLVAVAAFQAGWFSKSYPSEEEMIRRIVERRIEGRVRREVEAELATEIDRRASRS